MNHQAFLAKIEIKRERKEARADRLERDAQSAFAASHNITKDIPFGQPILVGHHSEGRHRRDIARSWSLLGKGVELQKQAERVRVQLQYVPSRISGDDDSAIDLLREEITADRARSEQMKDANRRWKKGRAALLTAEELEKCYPASLAKYGQTPDQARPYASFQLSNLNANIRRKEDRIKELERLGRGMPADVVGAGWHTEHDGNDNRLRIVFDAKPDAETIKLLKSSGFKWAPSVGAWQRQDTLNARYSLNRVLDRLREGVSA